MTDTTIEVEFEFEGEDASDAAWELSERLASRVGISPSVRRHPSGSAPPTRSPVVEILSLLLTLPSAIISTDQLVAWIKKRRQATGEQDMSVRKTRILIRIHEVVESMDEGDMSALVDLLEQAKRADESRTEPRG